jgi:hypothetical protein
MNQNFEMDFFISAAVFCHGVPWNTFCVLVKPDRLLCVSVTSLTSTQKVFQGTLLQKNAADIKNSVPKF